MVRILLWMAALVAAPWLTLGGLLWVVCDLLLWGQPGQVAAGVEVAGIGMMAAHAAFDALAEALGRSPAPETQGHP